MSSSDALDANTQIEDRHVEGCLDAEDRPLIALLGGTRPHCVVTRPPSWARRIYGVWLRHVRVYSKNLISNALPPFLEPLIFLVGIGLGLGQFIGTMNGAPYIEYLATGLMVTAAMFTAAFECSFGTYIRLEFDKVYDGMLGAPMSVHDLLIGEMLWAGTKGFVFTFSVMVITTLFGIVPLRSVFFAPLLGFITGTMFAALGFLMTSIVDNINQFNFFFSGFISPMFFFAGVFFPVENLPAFVRPITEILPLTHPVRLMRGLFAGQLGRQHLFSLGYVIALTVAVGAWGISRLKRKLID
ncbi:MAG: ABC transporter [Spirochaetaceae bacterium]|nr:MAG: ABC transporter [Spirochaetaceae bacterium]